MLLVGTDDVRSRAAQSRQGVALGTPRSLGKGVLSMSTTYLLTVATLAVAPGRRWLTRNRRCIYIYDTHTAR